MQHNPQHPPWLYNSNLILTFYSKFSASSILNPQALYGLKQKPFPANLGMNRERPTSFRYLQIEHSGVNWNSFATQHGDFHSNDSNRFYDYGTVHRWYILIIVQRDATQSSLFIILQDHSTCFGCQPHPSSGVHKTVNTLSATVQLPPFNVVKLHSTGGCSYSFVYSCWWVWLTLETCRLNLQNNK